MLTNIVDNDLLKENGLSLIQKFSYYMSNKKTILRQYYWSTIFFLTNLMKKILILKIQKSIFPLKFSKIKK